MPRRSAAVLALCVFGGGAEAAEIEAALTDETIEGRYITDAPLLGLEDSDFSVGAAFTDDRDFVGNLGLMVPGVRRDAEPGPITVSVGGKAIAALLDDPDDDVFGLAPGAQVRIGLPTGMPTAVVANIFYAPDIVSFGDAEDIIDFNARFEIQFLESTTGFVGYRLLNFDREEGGDDDIINSVQAGLRFAF